MPEKTIFSAHSIDQISVIPAKMRRLAIACLIGAAIWLAGAAPLSVTGGQALAANEESNELLEEAKQAMKDGKVQEAFIHLKNAVRADPDNVDARFLLGEFNLRRGDAAGAEKEFREARRRGMTDSKVLKMLAQAYLMQGKAKELLAEITTDNLEGETKITAHTLRARAYVADNKIEKAREELELGRPGAAESGEFHAADAEVLQRAGDLPAAEAAIDRALALSPKIAHAHWIKAELRRSQRDLKGALESYNKALELDENLVQGLVGRTFVYLALNRFEEAEADADKILKRIPEMPMALYFKAVLLSQRGENEKALEILQPVEFRIVSFMPAVYLLANLNLRLNRLEGAINYAERYHAANPEKPDAVKLLSAVYLRQKRFPEAVKLLAPFEENESFRNDVAYLQILGNSYLAVSDYTSAARIFKSLQKLNPEDEKVREQLAITSLGLGEKDEAVRELEALAASEGGSDRANLLLILTRMRAKEYDKAEVAAASFVKQRPNSGMAHNLLGSVYLAQNKLPEASAEFEGALKVDPDFTPAVLNLAQLHRVDKKPEEAKKILLAHLERAKGNEKVLTQLADIAMSEKDIDTALKYLQQAAQENPKSEIVRLRLIDLQLSMKKPENALKTAVELNEIAPESPAALNALAQVQVLNQQLPSAVAVYRKLVTLVPTAPRAHLLLGVTLASNDNLEEAKTSLDEAIKLDPTYAEAVSERLKIELKLSGMAAAIKLAEKYRDEKPDNAMMHFLLADAYEGSGKYDEATAAYEKSLELNKSGATFRRLYVSIIRQRKPEEAFKRLQAWVKEYPEDMDTRLLYSTELIRRGDTEGAIVENEALNEKLPGRPVILNNLGWLYSRKGDARGIELVRTAYDLSPESPEIQDTYGWMLVQQSKVKEGLELLDKAAKALPKSSEVQYHYAAALAQSGKKAEALEILTRILTEKFRFEGRKEAEALLESLKAG